MSEPATYTEGVIKAWKVGHGYGFIRIDGGAEADAFVHITDVLDQDGVHERPTELAVGQQVRFRREPTDKGVRAREVELIIP